MSRSTRSVTAGRAGLAISSSRTVRPMALARIAERSAGCHGCIRNREGQHATLAAPRCRTWVGAPPAPMGRGWVELIVARATGGRRENPDRVRLEADAGIPGDAWGRQPGPHAERAITVMQVDVAELIANGQPLALFGDNLFLTLDLST